MPPIPRQLLVLLTDELVGFSGSLQERARHRLVDPLAPDELAVLCCQPAAPMPAIALFFPITSQVKGYPFEVAISLKKIKGVALADQIKSLDCVARKIKYIESAPSDIVEELKAKLSALLD
jgi:mRNA-degrading endonuclease toxin of MazEF toxin-antitoxin module